MPYNYDALYKTTPNALGAPDAHFSSFFQSYEGAPLRVLDIGCGQGRDALSIARLGHSVTGVDLSPHGIADMLRAAKAENLDVTGIAADIRNLQFDQVFDVLLIDRTLHMLDQADALQVLASLLARLRPAGYGLISDEAANIPAFKACVLRAHPDWRFLLEKRGYLFGRMT